MAALSRTERVRTWLMARLPQLSPMNGPDGLRARVGFRPNSPHADAGIRIEPPPSLPCAIGTTRLATATAEPPDEPPDVRVASHGFRVVPVRLVSVEAAMPSSGVVVLPKITTPARLNRATRVESNTAGGASSASREPHQVGVPAISTMSLSKNGTPWNR